MLESALSKRQKSRDRKRETPSTAFVIPQAMRHALLLAGVIVFAFVAYSNSFHTLFLFDNDQVILKDTRIQAVTSDNIRRILTHSYWEANPSGLYRPLTTLSYLFNYSVLGNGASPVGYHWFNLILHSINIGLVYALGLAIFEQIPAALLLSALWGFHPVQTEAVTNIVGRADLLAGFSVLAAVLCYRKAVQSSGARYVAWLAAIMLALTVGMFSKESAIVAVGVVALYDLTFVRGVSWRSRIPGYIAVAVPCLVFLYVRAQVIASAPFVLLPFTDNPLIGAGFWTARMTAVKVIGRYFQLLVWPARLSFDYSYNAIPLFGWKLSGWEDWKAVFALVTCSAAAVAALIAWRRNKPVFFAIAFFFITLAPASNLVILIGSIMGERFLYLPSVGFAVIVVWAFYAIRQRKPRQAEGLSHLASSSILGVILIAFAVRTYDRNLDWQDQQRFWRSAVEAAPGSYKAHIGAISNQLQVTQQDWQRSLGDVSRALATLDGLPDVQNAANAYCDAGIFYRSLGEKVKSKTEAAEWYQKSLDALLRSEKILRAQDDKYRDENARRGKPGLTFIPSVVYLELGRTYSRLSEPKKAIEAFERGRSLESDPDVLEELASAYRADGDLRKAALALVEAMSVDSSRTQLTSKLVELYAEIDPRGCAINRRGGAASLNLDCPLVHGDLCTASRNVTGHFLRRGQKVEAAAIRRIAVQELGCEAAGLE
jgi:tetratricopeptide (TPR) repeat protein